MNIVIVESPAKAKTINKYLGASYEVLASFGHVRDLPAKNGSVDPDANFQMIWEIDPKAAGRLNDIAKALKGADKLILALAIGVGRQDQPVSALERLGDVIEPAGGLGVDFPDHLEVGFRINRSILRRQVTDMAE